MLTRTIKCSHCGAPLDVPEDARSTRCAYCGTQVRIEPRAPAPPPVAAPPAAPTPSPDFARRVAALQARPRPSAAGRVVTTLVLVLVLGGGGLFVALQKSGCSALGSDQWEGVHGAILADVNGDGAADIVGRMRRVTGGDRVWLAAFDGATGKELWKSEALGPYLETYQGMLGLAEDTLLYASAGGELVAFGLRDGQRRWRASLPEKATGFCAGDAGTVRVGLANKSEAAVRLSDGQAAPRAAGAAGAASPCKRLADDGEHGDPSFETEEHPGFDKGLPGLRVDLELRRADGPRILLGTRSEGTQVPMIGVVYPADPARTWKSELAATRPLETGPFGPEAGAVTNDRVFTVYQFTDSSRPRMLVAFDLSGHRLWESPLPNTAPLSAVQAADGRVLVSQWGRIQSYDGASGKQLFAIGSGFP
ncbi:MAG: PQQ-binding-like beta-propeller repeat protein [Myxococcales bacterium]|nr:PQQ-binding-like beta-propeller repeat protein [Myxococcales bacterium]